MIVNEGGVCEARKFRAAFRCCHHPCYSTARAQIRIAWTRRSTLADPERAASVG